MSKTKAPTQKANPKATAKKGTKPAKNAEPSKNGKLSAISGVCTHQGCLLRHNEAAGRLDCPCHRASFSLQGDVLRQQFRQPIAPLPHIQVRENNGQIEINDARPV